MPRRSPGPWLLCATALALGCAHASRRTEGAAGSDRTGHASFVFVPDPGRLHRETGRETDAMSGPRERLIPPVPRPDNQWPQFPSAALTDNAGRAVVGLRFVVDLGGGVTRIADSPVVPSTAGPFAPLYREAAEAALREWRFVPALRERRLSEFRYETVAVPCYLDVRFTFEVLDGTGAVR